MTEPFHILASMAGNAALISFAVYLVFVFGFWPFLAFGFLAFGCLALGRF